MANRANGTLYVGVTSDLNRRAWEHKQGEVEGFAKRYRLDRLVYAERHDRIEDAIQRESNIKHWKRSWKIDLIVAANPSWDDLFDNPL